MEKVEKNILDKKVEKKKKREKEKKKRTLKANLIRFILILALIVVILTVARYILNLNTEIIEMKNFYQWIGHGKVEYSGVISFSEVDGTSQARTDNKNYELDFTPVYYNEEPKILLSYDMAVVSPLEDGKINKLTRFSVLENKENVIYLQNKRDDKKMQDIFLFNGKDLYVFLEETTVIVDGKEYVLSPMSYVNVTYRQVVEIYDKKEDKGSVIITKDPNVTAKANNYTIDMSIDAMMVGSKEQLLMKSLENLSLYE